MVKNKLFKIIISILILLTLFMFISQTVSAIGVSDAMKDFKNHEIVKDKSEATKNVTKILSSTINIVQVVGAGVAVVMLVVLGIRWISESPSGKAQIAKGARYYVLGAVFIFAAIGLLQLVKTFTQDGLTNEAKWS